MKQIAMFLAAVVFGICAAASAMRDVRDRVARGSALELQENAAVSESPRDALDRSYWWSTIVAAPMSYPPETFKPERR